MAYGDDIDNLGADHRWDFDGNSNDAVGSANGTNSGVVFTGSAITEDATNCMTTNTIAGDRVTLPTTTTINNSAQARKAVAGWFEITEFSPHPVRIYGEGSATTCFQFALAFGNQLLFECVEPTNFATGLQVYGIPAVPNRVYHLCGIFEGNGHGNEIRFYVDGIEQTAADPSDRQPDTASLDSRGVGEFGDPAGGVGIGAGTVLLQAGTNINYQHWCAWGDEADAVLTDTEVRETLFERGALADFTVSTGTEGAMQTALNAIADAQGNSPCCIEIEAVSGGGDFTLTSPKTFDDLASIHYRYNGTADTLTIVNTGSGNATSAKCAAPFGGTISVANRQTLTVTALDAATGSPVQNARVYLIADTGGPLTADTVIMNELTNASGVATTTFDYTADQPIVGIIRQGSSSTFYAEAEVPGPLTVVPLDATVFMVPDE